MKSTNYLLAILITGLSSFFQLNAYAQEGHQHQTSDSTKSNHQMMHDSSMQHKMHNMKMMNDKNEMMDEKQSPLIRKGIIDLKAIDENKDGKVFQDQMDFNVISDKAGECPLCGMKLKEVSLKEAKAKLVKYGYKVVDN